MTGSFRVLVLAMIVSITMVACGDGDGGDGDGSKDIEVTAVDFRFTPDAWTITAGTAVTVTFTNDGTLEHNWVVLSTEIESEGDLTESIILFTVEAAAGESVTATLSGLGAGTYQVICDIPGHFSAGMEGMLQVTG